MALAMDVGPQIILDGSWHYIGVTYTTGTGAVKTYVDGQLDNSSTLALNTVGQNNFIGKSNHGGFEQYFPGSISILEVYDRDITANEVKQNCRAQMGRFTGSQCANP